MLTHLDLFSGIGGFALAAQRCGFTTVGFCEIEPYAQEILSQHWPEVPICDNIFTLSKEWVDIAVNECYFESMAKKDSKYNEARSLYESGLSIQDCADYYGISRQGMYDILIRRGTQFRPQLKFNSDNHFYRGGLSADDRAQNLAEKAIKKGLLIRKPCEICGEIGTFKDGRCSVQAHHDDYNKPLEIRWLCQKHHHEWHKHNRPIQRRKEDTQRNSTGRITLLTGGFP